MPRTSIDALMLEETGLAVDPRPDAPYELDDAEADQWRRIVNCMPPDHFIPANYPVLAQLCRHIIESHKISTAIKAYSKRKQGFNIREYGELTKQQDACSLAIGRLSRSLRLTQQANFHQSRRLPKPNAYAKPHPIDDDKW